MTRTLTVLLTLACLACGCSRSPAWLDRRDREQPLIQRAAARASAGDIGAAIRLYHKALEQDPEAARAHLDVAFLLQDHRKDYVSAIYHYKRFLDLRPGSEKQTMVEERIRMAEQLFAADVLGPNRVAEKLAAVERENAQLKVQVANLSERLQGMRRPTEAPPAAPKPAVGTAPASHAATAPAAPPAPQKVGTYRVVNGDSLTSIATKVYGDAHRWKEIQMANSDILGNSSQVKPGQVLVIP